MHSKKQKFVVLTGKNTIAVLLHGSDEQKGANAPFVI